MCAEAFEDGWKAGASTDRYYARGAFRVLRCVLLAVQETAEAAFE